MPKSAHTPAHRGAPRPFRVTPASVVRSHVKDVARGRAKISARVLLTSGLTAGALMAAPAANAVPAGAAPHESGATSYHVVKTPTIEMSALGAVQHRTELKVESAAFERAVEAKRRAEARAKARAEARARAIAASRSGRAARALSVARSHMGAPYVWGATGPSAFDCSGLVQFAYAAAGISLPRTADAQSHAVRTIPSSQLQPGDLIFFGSGHVYHVGFFLRWENGQAIMVHAPHPGAVVREEAAWGSDWHAGTLR